MVNVLSFTKSYVLMNLTPSTQYSIYVITVRLIRETNETLKGNRSVTATSKTLGKECILLSASLLIIQLSFYKHHIRISNAISVSSSSLFITQMMVFLSPVAMAVILE